MQSQQPPSAAPVNERGRPLFEFLRALHAQAYLAAKARDFGSFTFWALLVTAIFVLFTIVWDYAVDPVNAPSAIGYRILMSVAVLLWALASLRHVHSLASRMAALLVPLVVEASFIEVLSRLDQGALYGVGGFLYFFIFVPFLLLAQSFALSVAVLAAIVLFPVLAASLGLSAGIEWRVYNAYMLISFLPIVAIRLFFEYQHWHLLCYRQQMERQALTDGLTRLPNRRHFLAEGVAHLDRHRRTGEPISLLFIDIDHFKAINDTHGHRIGDLAIDHVGCVLSTLSRDSDLLARYGGEEFLVLLPHTEPAQAKAIAERMRQAVSTAPMKVPEADVELALTVSIGIAGYDPSHDDTQDIDGLINEADLAVYAAKRYGRNRVVCAAPIYEPGSLPSA